MCECCVCARQFPLLVQCRSYCDKAHISRSMHTISNAAICTINQVFSCFFFILCESNVTKHVKSKMVPGQKGKKYEIHKFSNFEATFPFIVINFLKHPIDTYETHKHTKKITLIWRVTTESMKRELNKQLRSNHSFLTIFDKTYIFGVKWSKEGLKCTKYLLSIMNKTKSEQVYIRQSRRRISN